MHHDPRSRIATSPRSRLKKLQASQAVPAKAPNSGAFVFLFKLFVTADVNLARPLQYPSQVIRFTTRFGDLGTGRPGIPLFTPGARCIAMRPPFWDPWYRQAGGSLFTPDRRSQRSPPLLGTLIQAGQGFPLLFLASSSEAQLSFGCLGK